MKIYTINYNTLKNVKNLTQQFKNTYYGSGTRVKTPQTNAMVPKNKI